MPPAELRVVLAEDSYLVREGVRRLLESTGQVEVLAAVGTADELLAAVDRLGPQAVITDIRMPPGHSTEGIQAAHAIRAAHPDVGVVVLSQHAEAGYVLELLKHGADGLAYLLKERIGDRKQLVHAVRETSRGGSVIDPVLVDALVGRRRLEQASGLADLTDRELDVLRAMAQGCRTRRWRRPCSCPSPRSRNTSAQSSPSSDWRKNATCTEGWPPSWRTCAPQDHDLTTVDGCCSTRSA